MLVRYAKVGCDEIDGTAWKGGSHDAVQDYHHASDEDEQLFFLSSQCVSLFSCEGGNHYCRSTVWIGTGFFDHTDRMVRDAFQFVRAMLKHFETKYDASYL